ncbi:CsgG/HfaB family protein [Candidatus Nitrospira salsa]
MKRYDYDISSFSACRRVFVLLLILMCTACQSMRIAHDIPDPGPNCERNEVLHADNSLSWSDAKSTVCGKAGMLCRSTVTSIMVKQRPEVSLENYKNIAFTDLSGNAGEEFAAALMDKIVQDNTLQVLDRTQVDRLKEELRFEKDALFDKKKRLELGKLLPGTVLVIGEIDQNYEEEVSKSTDSCQNSNSTKGIPCEVTTRTGRAVIQGNLHITETETGRQLKVKRISRSATEETKTIGGGEPSTINAVALKDKAFNAAVHDFERSILPTKEKHTVVFYKDGKIPKLQRGIREAEAGDLNGAKQYFVNAIHKYETRAEIPPESLAAAYFNLGVVHTFERDHEMAVDMFKKVDDLALNTFQTISMRNINKCLKESESNENLQNIIR